MASLTLSVQFPNMNVVRGSVDCNSILESSRVFSSTLFTPSNLNVQNTENLDRGLRFRCRRRSGDSFLIWGLSGTEKLAHHTCSMCKSVAHSKTSNCQDSSQQFKTLTDQKSACEEVPVTFALRESHFHSQTNSKEPNEEGKLEGILLSPAWKLFAVAGCTAVFPVILSVTMLSVFPVSTADAVEAMATVGESLSVVSVSSSLLSLAPEPSNALSLPTWVIHVSSVVEWITAMILVWKYGEGKGREAWKSLSWGMVPSLGGAMCACTWHFFYNSPSLEILVALQGALTVIGNCTLWASAYRIYSKSPKTNLS